MTIKEYIELEIQNIQGATQTSNPENLKLLFIENEEAERLAMIKTCKLFYIGDSNKLLAWFKGQQKYGFNSNIIFNQNKRNYFWSESSQEENIKRVHSGLPNAIIDVLASTGGVPKVALNPEYQNIWDSISEENNFNIKLTQQARTLTMACGYGAWKINIDKEISDIPLWEFYDAEDIEYLVRSGVVFGVIFKSYYKKDDKNYILCETRYRQKSNSYIIYRLFEGNEKDIKPVPLETLNETKVLKDICLNGLNRILAVPTSYFYNANDNRYGKSLIESKIDLFDFYDEIWSIASMTNRSSVPITWVAPDVMDRGANGLPTMPSKWNMSFMQKPSVPDGEGNVNEDIQITQPNLNSDQYARLAVEVLTLILSGIISPASMGIDLAKKDNAEAQREKEKITLMMRNNFIASEKKQVKQIVELTYIMFKYLETGSIPNENEIKSLEVNVDYNEFATPTFDEMLGILGNAYASGEISTENYVNRLYPDWTDEEKTKEIEWLENNKESEGSNMDELLGNDYANAIRPNVSDNREEEASDELAESEGDF